MVFESMKQLREDSELTGPGGVPRLFTMHAGDYPAFQAAMAGKTFPKVVTSFSEGELIVDRAPGVPIDDSELKSQADQVYYIAHAAGWKITSKAW